MPIIQYKAYDALGNRVSGTTEASGLKEAAEKLKKDGLYIKELCLPAGQKGFFAKGKVSQAALIAATRELSVLINSGTPLYDALSLLANEKDGSRLGAAFFQIKEMISSGNSFAKALESRPDIFLEIYVRTVEAGEESGTLDGALLRLSDYLEARAKIRGRMTTALYYPALMSFVGVGVLSFIFIFVLPKIAVLFDDTGRAMPLITRALLIVVNLLRTWWPLFIGGAVVSLLSLSAFIKSPRGRGMLDRLTMKLPLAGGVFVKFHMANFSRTLGSLMASGVPMLKALDMTRKVLNHAVFETVLRKAVKDVTEGRPLSASLKSSGEFSGVLLHMIATGEKSGELDALLLKAAQAYEGEFETAVSRGLALLEPGLILAMGAMVGFIVLAILLPIFELNQIIR